MSHASSAVRSPIAADTCGCEPILGRDGCYPGPFVGKLPLPTNRDCTLRPSAPSTTDPGSDVGILNVAPQIAESIRPSEALSVTRGRPLRRH